MSLKKTVQDIIAFRDARDWKKFHTPRNVASALSVEASELVEIFQWTNDAELEELVEQKRSEIQDEIADILIYALTMAHDLDMDVCEIIEAKIKKNEIKHPIEESRFSFSLTGGR
jgi:NTP pyrophosphatase (non-canonical NTP hydrolase)